MSSTKYNVPTDVDINTAEINGFKDGLAGNNETAYMYTSRDILYLSYIRAKKLGSKERVILKNREVRSRFKQSNIESLTGYIN